VSSNTPRLFGVSRRWAVAWAVAVMLGCSAPPEEEPSPSNVVLTRVERLRPQALEGGELGAQPPQVEVRGRLLLERLPQAAEWIGAEEPLRVCIARFPDVPLESTGGVGRGWLRQADSELGVFFGHAQRFMAELDVTPDGRFYTQFPAGLLEPTPGELSRFAMVLGRPGTDDGVPELLPFPDAFATLELRGESALPVLERTINAVGRPLPGFHDPVALAMAVNRLRDEGKRGALDALRSYVDRARASGYRPLWWRRAEDPADLDVAVIAPIVQLLFEPGPAAPPFPSYDLPSLEAFDGGGEGDGLYPLRMIDGLPYLLGQWQSGRPGRGASFDPEPFLEWAERHGRIRSRPLSPGGDPLGAIEQLELDSELAQRNQLRLQVLFGFGRTVGLEARQALAAEVGLLQPPTESGLAFRFLWTRLTERLRQDTLRWDFKRHRYAPTQGS
jgi:hypothetical protein